MKDIIGYEGLYAITSCGKIWNYSKGKFIKQSTQSCGYKQVGLRKNGIVKRFLVHRLVAMMYIPNPDNLREVNHKDENKQNNCVNNLEWCDRKYNLNYGHAGDYNKEKSISVRCIETGKIYNSLGDVKRDLGIQPQHLSDHLKGKHKHCKGYHFEFINKL